MLIKKIAFRSLYASLLVFGCGLAVSTGAQTPATSPLADSPLNAPQQQTERRPMIMRQENTTPTPAAKDNELYCGGFIQYAPSYRDLEVVGGEQEQEKRIYASGDTVFVNSGSAAGVRVGDEFSVIRPRGRFTSKFTNKKGTLGVYTQEVGRLRVTDVKERVSVAQVVATCEAVLLGDLLIPATQHVSPVKREETTFDRFRDPNGKATGRIVLARDGREVISSNQIVFIDLGAEDNVKQGDHLTVYRPAGTGNITRFNDKEEVTAASGGFESDRFKGGKFSNQAQRARDLNNPRDRDAITTPEVKRRRPPVPRKVVGELVILGVQQRTATAVITRVAQEVHTGDYVELQ